MTLNMKNGCVISFRIKHLDTQTNLCKKYFNPESIKNNNGAVTMRFFCATQTEPTTSSINKWQRKGIEDLQNCAVMFLFFILIKLKVFCVKQIVTHKMVKFVRLYE